MRNLVILTRRDLKTYWDECAFYQLLTNNKDNSNVQALIINI